MLKHRLITGPILIATLVAIVVFDDWLDTVELSGLVQDLFVGRNHFPRGLAMFGLALIVAPIAALELSAIFRANGIMTRPWLTAAAAVLGLFLSYGVPMGTSTINTIATVSTGLVIAFVAALLTFSRHRNVEGVVAAAGAIVFAMVYLGLMLGFLLALRRQHTAWWIIGVLLTTKSCDIGAYFTGRLVGRHKLIPWLSPGKTWEGLIGGVITATLVGTGCAAASTALAHEADHVPLAWGAAAGAVFAVVGQFGDLTMSLFKRGAGMKDSSRILPGLGGVLDVLDSPMMVAPVAYWMLAVALPRFAA